MAALALAACDRGGQWWCSTHVCVRTQAECTKLVPLEMPDRKSMDCSTARIAFCPLGATDRLTCQPTLERCNANVAEYDAHLAVCVGVE